MRKLVAHLPPNAPLDALGNAPWPHPTILAEDLDAETGRVGLYRAILGRSGVRSDIEVVGLPFTRPALEGGLLAGFTNESLLAIVLDRLESFQTGTGGCEENEAAIGHVVSALVALHDRSVAWNSPHAPETRDTGAQGAKNGDPETGIDGQERRWTEVWCDEHPSHPPSGA